MSYPYFFIEPANINSGEIIIEGDNHNHLTRVLRAKLKDIIEFSDNKNYRYITKIIEINKKNTLLEIIERKKIAPENIMITLFQCMLKRTSMELVVQKAAELGINGIFPVKSRRVIIEDRSADDKTKRWGKIAEEASKQCKRDFILNINERISLTDIRPSDFDVMYLSYEELDKSSVKDINIIDDLKELIKKRSDSLQTLKIGFITGPEGGFEEKEIKDLVLKGAKPISLGSNILKAETASVFLASIIRYTASVFF